MEHAKAYRETRKAVKPSKQAIKTTGAKKASNSIKSNNFVMRKLLTEAISRRRIKTACKLIPDLGGIQPGSEMQRFKFPILHFKIRKTTDLRGPLFKRIARANRT
jgi:hypothetical protein